MAKQTTRDAALSRLFGNATEGDEPEAAQANTQAQAPGTSERKPRKKAGPSKNKPPEPAAPSRGGERGGGEGSSKDQTSPSGYIGLGRYSRTDGVVERITPYVRPDQAEALRIAVARKSDPRGTDISQIIQSLLDEAGYRS